MLDQLAELGELCRAGRLGAVAGRLGDNVSLGFVAETERQVERHLGSVRASVPGVNAPVGPTFVVVDLDGVLADTRHRLHWLDIRPKQWSRFFAAAVDELEAGLWAVAAPLRDAGGTVIAALSISGPTVRLHEGLLDERAILAPHFSNLEGPVFALTNLPEVVKGALFARYSRSTKSLRRLFLPPRLPPGRARGRLRPRPAIRRCRNRRRRIRCCRSVLPERPLRGVPPLSSPGGVPASSIARSTG